MPADGARDPARRRLLDERKLLDGGGGGRHRLGESMLRNLLPEPRMHSLASTVRGLKRTPWFRVTSVASIAIGLALSTATFAFVDATLHPTIPYDQPDQLFYPELRLGNQKT